MALVSSSFHPYVGGVEEHVQRVAAELKRRGHDVVVWTVDRGEALGIRNLDGVEVRYLPTPLPSRTVRGVGHLLRNLPSAAAAWRAAFRSFRPDVVHVQCFGPNGTYASVLAALTGTPLVVSSHGETFADDHAVFDRSGFSRRALSRAMRQACAVTGCSPVVLRDLARFAPVDGLVAPNGVDLRVAVPPRSPASPPNVLAYGRVERMKGFDLLLDAFAQAAVPPGTRLVIAGTGSEAPALQAQARALGVADRVAFTGQLSRAEVAAQLAQASVVVVPSRREAFGLVVLEAWRAGAPVVATSHGGPADLVTHGVDGLVATPEDPSELGTAIASVLTQPELAAQLSEGGRRTVLGYGWDRVADAYESVYAGCARSSTSARPNGSTRWRFRGRTGRSAS